MNNSATLSSSLSELKAHMSSATTIKEWNGLREQAKSLFIYKVICELDGSGFVNTLNLVRVEKVY